MEKECLKKLVKECNSFAEILRKQNKAVSGAAVKLLKQKLDDYGIIYHFINNKSSKKLELFEILKENISYKSSDLKIRLIKEGLKENKCECCGLPAIWNDKILTLQLHHINGNHLDNRLENLQVLCPNCHSQTDTFGGANLKIKHFCKKCGKELSSKKSTYCKKCAASLRSQNRKVKLEDRPSKEELLTLILTKPFTDIGKMYNVSDNSIRKWAKNYNLPSNKKEIREYLHKFPQ